jgi:hypothetical protein
MNNKLIAKLNARTGSLKIALTIWGAWITAAVHADVVVIDFEGVNATGSSVTGAALDTYLAQFGVTISNVSPSGYPEIHNVNDHGPLSGFPAGFLVPSSGTNFLSHGDGVTGGAANSATNAVISYRLNFSTALENVSFTHLGITSGLTADWQARALDALGNTLDTVSQPLQGGHPLMTFTLDGPGITALVIERVNFNGIAGVNTAFIDDITFTAIPEPASGLLLFLGSLGVFGLTWRRSH